jgi:hypothetical protein
LANPLLDFDFLRALDQHNERTVYARITALDLNENPIEQIEGRVTGGSLNVDGASSSRRTCSLTLVGDDIHFTDFYWAIKSKFKLEIGLFNTIDRTKYDDIIWFN